MQTDLLLATLRQVLDDRSSFKTHLDQARAAYGDGRPPQPPPASSLADDIQIVSEDIHILPESGDSFEIQITRTPISAELNLVQIPETAVRILEAGSSSISAEEPVLSLLDEGESGLETIFTLPREDAPDTVELDFVVDELQFDENWADQRVKEIKRQVEQDIQAMVALTTEQVETASTFARNRDALLEDYDLQANSLNREISNELAKHQRRQSSLDQQIDQETRRLRQAQQGFFYQLLSFLGLRRQDASQLKTLQDEKRNEDQTHSALLPLLQEQHGELEGERQQKIASLLQVYRDRQQRLSNQMGTIYGRVANQLIPEAQSILSEWLCQLSTELRQLHPDWSDPVWSSMQADELIKWKRVQNPGLRVGTLVYEEPVAPLPAVIDPIGNQKHVLVQGGDSGRRAAEMRAMLLRMVLSFPVGLTRVVLVDGVEQGHTLRLFGTKLHKDIRGDRVYDREPDIAEQLNRLRDRISQINLHVLVEHDSIDSYNQANPELPSPYQFVVINEFPNGFNAQALRAFQDIVRNGPRAGVFILATMAESLPRPQDFDLNSLYSISYLLQLDGNGTFQWNSEYLGAYRVRADEPLRDGLTVDMLSIASNAYDMKPMVLKYERIARDLPPRWSVPTSIGLRAPVGLTFGGKLHEIEFSDEFVHGLIGGRTGSGKTVFLHDLICGLAQVHSPEELHLYLLDFRGTEFNVYAKNKLPHAQVIAVDCDVEIGLNVIKRLAQEMDRRRKLLDDANVPDIRRYRQKELKLPRILLIIDEIQVLTQSVDSRLQRDIEAGLIDLLRRGRGAGIHVLLGTQSPSQVLSAQMLQQIAIRICLLADQQVSRLVLGETNEAASGLQKQGEAVYNAYNGMPEKNVFMRAALLETELIVDIVHQLARQAQDNGYRPSEQSLYFDGRSRNTLLDNPILKAAVETSSELVLAPQVTVPLGNSIEIKEDTAVQFVRERYSNLLIVGGEVDHTHALLRNATLALCIQQHGRSSSFYVIDLAFEGLPFAGSMRVFQAMPHEFQFARNPGLGLDLIEEVYEALSERRELARQGRQSDQSIWLVMSCMENFTDMHAPNRFDLPESRKKLEEILADGPSLGIHAVVSTQTFDKGTILKPDSFGQRVCFQVAEDDSRLVLDSDAGTKIMRVDRAVLRQREWPYGKVEKFKPYLPPTEEDIRWIAKRLGTRAERGEMSQ